MRQTIVVPGVAGQPLTGRLDDYGAGQVLFDASAKVKAFKGAVVAVRTEVPGTVKECEDWQARLRLDHPSRVVESARGLQADLIGLRDEVKALLVGEPQPAGS